jgi:hypothetical protein
MIRSLVRYDVTICGIPELPLFREAGVSDVLSIIDPATPEPEAFASFAPHRRRTRSEEHTSELQSHARSV